MVGDLGCKRDSEGVSACDVVLLGEHGGVPRRDDPTARAVGRNGQVGVQGGWKEGGVAAGVELTQLSFLETDNVRVGGGQSVTHIITFGGSAKTVDVPTDNEIIEAFSVHDD